MPMLEVGGIKELHPPLLVGASKSINLDFLRAALYENPEIAFGDTANLLALIELIYSAVDQPELWPAVLARTSAAMGGESLALFAAFPHSNTPDILALHEMPLDVWNVYATYYASVNPIMPRSEATLEAGGVAFTQHVISDTELERTEFYADFFHRNAMHHSCGTRIHLEDDLVPANMSCQRARRLGEFDEQAEIVYLTLKPHLRRALMLHQKFTGLEGASKGLEHALDAFGHAVFGLDRAGRVIISNRQAEAIVRKGDALLLSQGMLAAVPGQQDRELQVMLSGAVAAGSGFGLSAGGWMLVDRKSDGQPLRVSVTPVRFPLPGYPNQLAALVYVSDPAASPLPKAEALRALYGLTPTEARVADLIGAGLEVKEVGSRLGMTLETTRFHVKRIFAKTGIRRQVELVRMMASIPNLDRMLTPQFPPAAQ